MKIYFLDDGTITKMALDQAESEDNMIQVPDDKVPKDFAETFALGKYRVREGKIVKEKEVAFSMEPLFKEIPGIDKSEGKQENTEITAPKVKGEKSVKKKDRDSHPI